METTSFILGMLSIIAAAFAVVVVWGIVKINKLTFELKATHEWIDNNTRERDYNFEQVYKTIGDKERQTQFEVQEIYRQMAECRSYTDSRFDKATSLTSTKQLIKG
jgi:hypothetical protein